MTIAVELGRELLAMDEDQLERYMATLTPDDVDLVEAALDAADVELAIERKAMPLGKADTFRRLGYEPICKPRVLAVQRGVHPDDAPPPCGECPQERFHQAAEFDVFFAGAAGPGKSRGLVAEGLAAAMSYPGIRIAGFRRTYDELAESLLAELEKLDHAQALGATWNATKHELRFPNHSLIRFRYAETVDHAKRRMGGEYQLLLIDERGLVDPSVVDHLMERLRSSRPEIPVLGVRSASNPGGPGHGALKARYVDATDYGANVVADEHGRSVRFIPGKATDNPYLNEGYHATLDAIPDPARRAAMRDGSWDVFVGQFFGQWRRDLHTVEPFAMPAEWVRYVGVDYGYAAPWCALWAAVDGDGRVWVYRELYEIQVGETTQARRILAMEEATGEKPKARAADPSMWAKIGENNSIAQTYGAEGCRLNKANNSRDSGWARVQHYLADMPACQIHRAEDLDECPRLHVLRGACPNLVRTLPSLPRSKTKPEDVDTHAEDHCFAAGTLVATEHGPVRIEDMETGDQVLTRVGYRTVVAAGMTNPAAVIQGLCLSNGEVLFGTPNHPVWVESRGFVRLDALRYGDRLLACPESSESRSMALFSGATRTLSTPVSALTSLPLVLIASVVSGGSTRKSGRLRTGRSRTAATFTTETGTRSITTRRTSSALPRTSMSLFTLRTPKGSCLSGWLAAILRRWQRQPSGIAPKPGGNGTGSMVGMCGQTERALFGPATSAALSTTRDPVMALSGSVQTIASQPGDGRAASTTRSGPAQDAESRSWLVGTRESVPAPVYVLGRFDAGSSAVYNLTVEGQPEFFANGVLVHNCADALRYLLMEIRRKTGGGDNVDALVGARMGA